MRKPGRWSTTSSPAATASSTSSCAATSLRTWRRWRRDGGSTSEAWNRQEHEMKKTMTREDLYERAADLAAELYRMVHVQPGTDEFELSVEIRKAAQDVMTNLGSGMDPAETLDDASGASARLECLLLLAKDLAFFPSVDLPEFRKRA